MEINVEIKFVYGLCKTFQSGVMQQLTKVVLIDNLKKIALQ